MTRSIAAIFALLGLAGLLAGPPAARAADVTVGALTISKSWMRVPPKGATVAGGYLVITNKGSAPDRLIGGASPIAGAIEIHEMKMEGGVMKMRALEALEIKPGETVEFKPGGHHVMFMGLKQHPAAGGSVRLELKFETAGTVGVDLEVRGLGGKGSGSGSAEGSRKGS
jgi:hypothetical protein